MALPRTIVIVFLAITQVLAGCGDDRGSSAPSAPSPVSQPAPQPVPQPAPPQGDAASLRGFVADTAFRPLAGARVEVVDGAQAGRSATTDATGWFSLSGTFDDMTRFRATENGHVAATRTLEPCATCSQTRYLSFSLAVLAPPVSIAGDYTFTLVADSACATVPAELRTRSYAATIAPASDPRQPANTFFNATITGASFEEHHGSFPIGVAGDFVTFLLADHGPYLVEQVAPNTYFSFGGRPEVSVGTSTVSTISTSFHGWVDYCVLKSETVGLYYGCDPVRAVTNVSCESQNHRLVLTRR